MNKIFSLILILVLASGFVSAFNLMDFKQKIDIDDHQNTGKFKEKIDPYFVRMFGAGAFIQWGNGYIDDLPYPDEQDKKYENLLNAGISKTTLKNGVELHFNSVYYDCGVESSETGFGAVLNLAESYNNWSNVVGLGLKVGETKTVIMPLSGKKIDVFLKSLIVPNSTKLDRLFISKDLVVATVCDKDEPYTLFSFETFTTNKFQSYYSNIMSVYDTVYFIKPNKAYVVLKITELN